MEYCFWQRKHLSYFPELSLTFILQFQLLILYNRLLEKSSLYQVFELVHNILISKFLRVCFGLFHLEDLIQLQ